MAASPTKKNDNSSKTNSRPKKKRTWGRQLTHSVGVTANWIVAVLTVVCWLSTVTSPNSLPWLSFLGLVWPAFVVLNICFVALWAWRRSHWFALSLALLLLMVQDVRRTCSIPLHLSQQDTTECRALQVMSFNVGTFSTFKKVDNQVLQYIVDEQPDIICMQEFVSHSDRSFLNIDNILEILHDYPYHYITYTATGARNSGIATFSKYPIVQKQKIWFSATNNSAHYCDIILDTDTLRVFNCHMQSNQLTPSDFSEVKTAETESQFKHAAGIFGGKMSRAYRMRGEQADAVALEIRNSPYPQLVCGDFNDVPMSYTYKTLCDGLLDAHDESAWGPGYTFHKRGLGVRIDYILHSPLLQARHFRIGPRGLSDHQAVMSRIYINK